MVKRALVLVKKTYYDFIKLNQRAAGMQQMLDVAGSKRLLDSIIMVRIHPDLHPK